MRQALSKAVADQRGEWAAKIATMCSVFFAGQEPEVIGSALAALMATFLTNHKIPHDMEGELDLRTKLLTRWCETVWELVAANEGRTERKQ
jgi:hypothetical protein